MEAARGLRRPRTSPSPPRRRRLGSDRLAERWPPGPPARVPKAGGCRHRAARPSSSTRRGIRGRGRPPGASRFAAIASTCCRTRGETQLQTPCIVMKSKLPRSSGRSAKSAVITRTLSSPPAATSASIAAVCRALMSTPVNWPAGLAAASVVSERPKPQPSSR